VANAEKEVPDFLAETRSWEESKRVGAVLLKVITTNKSADKDLKVWVRIGTNSPDNQDGVNVALRSSFRKCYLAKKTQRIVEHILKVDPTKPYFFKNTSDIKLDLEVVVRNTEAP
jgi:hypothetical protein